jgi:hypothetical protein
MDWTDLAQDRNQLRALLNTVLNLRVMRNVEKFMSGWITGDFSST